MNPQMKRVEIATAKLVVREPFFASLLLRLEVSETDQVKTFATDGRRLLVNTGFCKTLDDAELSSVLCHEVMHCACLHMLRRGRRDADTWNIATDHIVNLELIAAGFTLPACALKDAKFIGMAEEAVYAVLDKQPKQPQPGRGNGQGKSSQDGPGKAGQGQGDEGAQERGMGEVLDAPGDEAAKAELAADWKVATLQAANAAKQQGRLPGFAAKLVEQIRKPKIDWRETLRNFMTALARNDYSWSRPNMRYAHTGFILPSLRSHGMGTVVLVNDTSGSTSAAQEKFWGAVMEIVRTVDPERTIMVQCDADIQSWEDLGQGDEPETKTKGYGGTSFRPPFERVENEGIRPDCLVYLTDGYGTGPAVDPGYPVLWAMTTDVKAPFGTTLRLEAE